VFSASEAFYVLIVETIEIKIKSSQYVKIIFIVIKKYYYE